jgi:hypothetical protein
VVDDAGLGGGVTDRLRELGELTVRPFNGALMAFSVSQAAGEGPSRSHLRSARDRGVLSPGIRHRMPV